MPTRDPSPPPDVFLAQALERDRLRDALATRGFTDDGDELVGDVAWTSTAGEHRTSVTIELGDAFPYGPPVVRLCERLRRATDPVPTFHLDADGALCLYGDQVEVRNAGWRDADCLLDKIAGWLKNTNAGWPGDTDTDLERYLPRGEGLLRYDADELNGRSGILLLKGDRVLRCPPTREPDAGKGKARKARRRQRSAARHARARSAYLLPVGELAAPLLTWQQVLAAAGGCKQELDRLVRMRQVHVVLVQYTRGGRGGVLALAVTHSAGAPDGVLLEAREAADVSDGSRRLRAGRAAPSLARRRVAVIGCGAVGSYVADLLLRSGVRWLTLVDHQILRPGNVVRHIAPDRMSGGTKVETVRATIAATGLSVEGVRTRPTRLRTLKQAHELALKHDLLIDACGDQRAAALLQAAARDVGGPLVKVCLQREGGIARVDRWPLQAGEVHAPEVPPLTGLTGVRERGCGDLVSLTPPHAVAAAAALAVRTACGVLTGGASEPSVVDVLSPQIDPPYHRPGPVRQIPAPPLAAGEETLAPPPSHAAGIDDHDPADTTSGPLAGSPPPADGETGVLERTS